MQSYVIRPGDYLSALAHRFNFDANAVWNSPKNAKLRELRGNPEVLHPGDLIYFEAGAPKTLAFKAATTNVYTVAIPQITVRLKLVDADGMPLGGKAFFLNGDTVSAGTTTADGLLETKVPFRTRDLVVTLEGCETVYQFRIGHLDPVDTVSGQRQRLAGLGYLADARADADTVRDAIERFQQTHGLTRTGAIDDATRKALTKAYGV